MSARLPLIAASLFALSLLAGASSASAACKTMGFTVNDYGKDGPTKDAKDLLDKHIATWATENGVEKYTVGKKTVKCELFLDVILFDEHTCTASASVCWGEGTPATPPKTAKEGSAKPSTTKSAVSEEKPPVETGTITPEAKPEPVAAKTEAPAAATPAAAPAAAAPESDAAERAAAAAERAAAAAERAAAAAEKAAGHKSASTNADAARQIAPESEAAKP